jgi:hypothetical protein
MASATLIASGRGQSTPAPEAKGVRGLQCPAEWPHVADAVIEAPSDSYEITDSESTHHA